MKPPVTHDVVAFGSSVVLLREDGQRQTFRIVGADEANPSKGTLSHTSPLAKSLLGRAVGYTVKAGTTTASIVNIS
jgi:transcription elongation GreA/GreB family factor